MTNAKRSVERLLTLADIRINGNRPQDIQVHDDRFYRRALAKGELGIGEAYMDGWWSSNALDQTAAQLLSANLRYLIPLSFPLISTVVRAKIRNNQRVSRAYKNAASHYNIGNDLYELMLDKRMVYSCGFWRDVKSLDEAQEAKLERICQKLYLKPGMHVLDIGCGWGGFAEYAARNYNVKVTGISPAAEQVKLAKERTKGLDVTILQKDYREVEGQFDRVVSVGMLEHVGPKNYRTFFTKCHVLLKTDGSMLYHFIGGNKSVHATNPWMGKYIFPGGVLPSLAQIATATERLLLVEDVENFGPDYDKTLLAWYHNFVAGYPQIKNVYNERFYRMWEYYLLTCAGGFRSRSLQLWQIVMRKIEPSTTYRGVR